MGFSADKREINVILWRIYGRLWEVTTTLRAFLSDLWEVTTTLRAFLPDLWEVTTTSWAFLPIKGKSTSFYGEFTAITLRIFCPIYVRNLKFAGFLHHEYSHFSCFS